MRDLGYDLERKFIHFINDKLEEKLEAWQNKTGPRFTLSAWGREAFPDAKDGRKKWIDIVGKHLEKPQRLTLGESVQVAKAAGYDFLPLLASLMFESQATEPGGE